MSKNHQTRSEAIAGVAAGIVTPVCLHPLDLIKTRLQVNANASPACGDSTKLVRALVHEGGLRTMYRGLTPNLLGNMVGLGSYFLFYSSFKQQLATLSAIDDVGPGKLNMYQYFIASGAAGAITTILTNPIWVIKTRMLTTSVHSTSSKVGVTSDAYPSLLAGARAIYRTEGISGFRRGLLPAMFGVVHGSLQFMTYERLKAFLYAHRVADDLQPDGHHAKTLSAFDIAVASGLSRMIAGGLTYPYQVLRSRMQTHATRAGSSQGLLSLIQTIGMEEGIVAFYRGMGPGLFRVLPSTWLTFLTYEKVKYVLGGDDYV